MIFLLWIISSVSVNAIDCYECANCDDADDATTKNCGSGFDSCFKATGCKFLKQYLVAQNELFIFFPYK